MVQTKTIFQHLKKYIKIQKKVLNAESTAFNFKKYKKVKTKSDSCLCRVAHIHINLHALIFNFKLDHY